MDAHVLEALKEVFGTRNGRSVLGKGRAVYGAMTVLVGADDQWQLLGCRAAALLVEYHLIGPCTSNDTVMQRVEEDAALPAQEIQEDQQQVEAVAELEAKVERQHGRGGRHEDHRGLPPTHTAPHEEVLLVSLLRGDSSRLMVGKPEAAECSAHATAGTELGSAVEQCRADAVVVGDVRKRLALDDELLGASRACHHAEHQAILGVLTALGRPQATFGRCGDRKSTRLNSSH